MVPLGVTRAISFAPGSVTQMFPSGPTAISPAGPLRAQYSDTAPVRVLVPTASTAPSVNQSFPSGPATISDGARSWAGKGYSVIVGWSAAAVAMNTGWFESTGDGADALVSCLNGTSPAALPAPVTTTSSARRGSDRLKMGIDLISACRRRALAPAVKMAAEVDVRSSWAGTYNPAMAVTSGSARGGH